ncbi:MAG: CoA transferase [Burkholderiaceae bacterium]|nr:CoA transferase [Burkholderiaceae bacterium]
MPRSPVLHGLVVVERGGRLAASVAAGLLGQLGATVLRLEDCAGRPASDPAAWHLHPLVLAGKQRVQASSAAGIDAAWHALSARAHVAFVSAPGAAPPGAPSAAALTVSLTAFGAGESAAAASELALQAASGAMATTGPAAGAPCVTRAPLLELLSGLNAATSVLAALRVGSRDITLDLSLFDTALALAGNFHTQALADPARLFRNGSRHTLCAPWNVYRTGDGWVSLCVASDEQWRRTATVIGQPELASDPALATSPLRVAAMARVDAAVTTWTSQRTVDEAVQQLGAAGLPVSAVRTPGPSAASVVVNVRDAAGVAREVPLPPVWFSETPLAQHLSIGPTTPLCPGETGVKPPVWPAVASGAPMRGLRVVEIGAYTAGPLAARYLADMGAEVIKVEPPGGEESRQWQPRVGHTSAYFANYNCGKRSVEIDLGSAVGAARLRDLIAEADVVVQTMTPGALRRRGIDLEALGREHPRLIACSISGYGRNGPPAPALDTVIQAASGLMGLVDGPIDEGPLKTGFSYADLGAAHVAAFGIVAAVVERDRSGRGQVIDVAMHDALVWLTQLGWPGAGCPPYRVSGSDAAWALGVADEPAEPVQGVADALLCAVARRRRLLREVPTGTDGRGWRVLASPYRWCAEEPAVGRGVALPGADNAGVFAALYPAAEGA